MYVPAAFKADDAKAWELVKARAFGTLVAIDNGRPVAVHVPLSVLDKRIEVHVARANPIHGIIAANPQVLVTVLGPDAYISPDWYVSHDQVPTWTYTAVHLQGTARLLSAEETHAQVEAVSNGFEARLLPKKIWTMDKMTEAKKAAMLRAIVGIGIDVTAIEASWKLNQHKPIEDRKSVVDALAGRPDENARIVSAQMRAMLP